MYMCLEYYRGVYVTVSHTSVVGVVTDCTSGLESDLDVLECLVNGWRYVADNVTCGPLV